MPESSGATKNFRLSGIPDRIAKKLVFVIGRSASRNRHRAESSGKWRRLQGCEMAKPQDFQRRCQGHTGVRVAEGQGAIPRKKGEWPVKTWRVPTTVRPECSVPPEKSLKLSGFSRKSSRSSVLRD